jgi:hypothetical protein
MEIVTYTIGVLIGLLPILVDLGASGAPAQVILDGRRVCTVTAEAPGCVADLGTVPRIHLLELARSSGNGGAASERVSTWINRPGVRPEVHASVDCDAASRACGFRISWGHPGKLDPSRLIVTLDGKAESSPPRSFISSKFPGPAAPQVATVEAVFSDGSRAMETRLLQGSYPESAEASLHAIPISVPPGPIAKELQEKLSSEGWKVHGVERGTSVVSFVVQPFSLAEWQAKPAETHAARALAGPKPADRLVEVAANEMLTSISYGPSTPNRAADWLGGLLRISLAPSHRFRMADAVAAAGFALGGSSGRRAVVLILGDPVEDLSAISVDDARRYLRETLVRLIVWRVGSAASDGWPEGTRISSPTDLVRQSNLLPDELDRQKIVWLEGALDLRDFSPRLPEGAAIGGREEALPARSSPDNEPSASELPSGGLAKQMVLALAVDPEHAARIYAATGEGLFRRDGAGPWQAIPFGKGPSSVNMVTARRGSVLAAGSAGIVRSTDTAGKRFSFSPMPPTVCVAADSAGGTILASTRGSVIRSADGGSSWQLAEKGLERNFVVALAADPDHSGHFWAGTAGQGLYQTTDGGKSWTRGPRILGASAVRAITYDSKTRTIWVGTDEGVFRWTDAEKNWQLLRAGMPRSPVYAIAVDPTDSGVVFAGTAAGLFSTAGTAPWKRMESAPMNVSAVAVDGASRRLVVGTAGSGVFDLPWP